jgi:flavin-dependent dehydrogenase
MWDAVIAGAGPAGSVCAHVLARNGRRVLLVDAIRRSEHKVGEALPGAALRLLRSLDLPLPGAQGPHTPIGGNLSCWNSEELIASDFLGDPDGPGWRLDRPRFDADLRDCASGSGAVFQTGRVTDLARRNGMWQIGFDNGQTAEARWVIDATGRSSALARRLGAKRKRDVALSALYATGEPQEKMRFNRTMVEAVCGGWWYAGLLPSGAPIAGFHLLSSDASQVMATPSLWRQALAATRYIADALTGSIFNLPLHAWDASGGRLDRFTGDGWIACGDAALSFDPISSQGIFSALHSGMASGMAVAAALDGDTAATGLYSARLEKIRRTYLLRCRSIYRRESRWPADPFWAAFGSQWESAECG